MKTYRVSANHPSPRYRADKLAIRVGSHEMDGRTLFYADAEPYGCGRDASTPEAAILSLLRSNGCDRIYIVVEG